ncbi:GNAT family N-acetyltransferase [Abyssisolibacter fermentans]|uniref:GNAT family N-acetyltransferase n=1 Tax=Abyssisolibacter fermentans TaxID=1766203 RepID=UPI000833A694|nr:GNAT family N-acetyltransferase [Abyssisolibacter fermentans]
MTFTFVPMNKEYATEMINNWKYGGEYSIYDYCNEEDLLLDEECWGKGKFAALDEEDNLVGELTIEFYEEEDDDSEDDGYVDHETVNNNPDKIYEMWVGWGLKPELTSKGLGVKFVSACVDFAVNLYNYKGEYVRCGVAKFNKRAIKVYERVGFEVFYTTVGEISGKELDVYRMRKRIK